MKNSFLHTKKILPLLSLICSVFFMVSCTNIPISAITPQKTTQQSQVAPTSSGTAAPSQAMRLVEQEIPFVSLTKSFRLGSSLPDPALLLVFDNPGLENVDTLISEADRSLVETIDFENLALLGAFWGVQPSGGHSITIDHVFVNGDELIMEVLLQENDPEFPKIEALTSPYHLVTIEKSLLSDKIQRYQVINDDEILASGPIR